MVLHLYRATMQQLQQSSQSCAMPAQWWLCVVALLLTDGAHSWFEDNYRRGRSRQVFSYPRDWDIDWTASQRRYWEPGGQVPEYNYEYQADGAEATSALRPRVEVLPKVKVETRGVWHSHQRGSALVPYPGASVRVRPGSGSSTKFYRGAVTSTITDGSSSKRRSHRNNRHGNKAASHQDYWQYSQDEPVHTHPKVCARCPSDRAVLAKRGASTVLMEVPPTIPCHPWSSVEKVRQEIVAGPQPGTEVQEGSHKVVIRLYHRRRTLATCVIRYNVIVRQCEELVPGPGLRVTCPQGQAWGAACNFSCDPGYQLEGDSYIDCNDNLEWSGEIPRCLPTTLCPVPASPDNGHLSCRTPQHRPATVPGMLPDGSVCHYHCDAGYTVPPTQQRFAEVRCVAGNWDSHMDPACVETNELYDEDLLAEQTDPNTLSFDGAGCPEGFCQNGGRCIMILGSPMCSCLAGHSGLFCEDVDAGLDQSNSIT